MCVCMHTYLIISVAWCVVVLQCKSILWSERLQADGARAAVALVAVNNAMGNWQVVVLYMLFAWSVRSCPKKAGDRI